MAAAITGALAAAAAPVGQPARLAITATGVALTLAALVDVHEHRLPNRLLAAGFVAALAGAALAGEPSHVTGALLGGTLAGALLLGVRIARGVGMGDVKMAAVVGAGTGSLWVPGAALAIAIAAATAAAVGAVSGRQRLPLGPALWLGWVTMVVGAGWWA